MKSRAALLHQAAALAADFLDTLPDRDVRGAASRAELIATMGGPVPEHSEVASDVVANLARAADPGIVASAGPRYFGFVIGGGLPAALAADWLTSTWDQNGYSFVMSPAASVAEEIAAGWILELLGLPSDASVGFTTGVTMASFTGLAAGRHRLLQRLGWDVEDDGLAGAPELAVVIGAEAHATIYASLQMLGLGRNRVIKIEADVRGRMRVDALRATLATFRDRPVLVAAQAGNVNTGSFDPLTEIAATVHELPNAWLHVDGAFGIWAAVAPARRHLVAGLAGADSWSTDGHKWLNVPYDSGIVVVRDQDAHRSAMLYGAAYYVPAAGGERDGGNWVGESSRRARGIPIYAAIRELGREGLADLVERCCALAERMADRLRGVEAIAILNEVVLNQVLVRFAPPGGADPAGPDAAADAFTREVIAAVQADGTCWLGGTTWHGMAAMRISVSNWMTTEADIDVSADAILRCARAMAAATSGAGSPAGE